MSNKSKSEHKYWAFISYSSLDRSWGNWLHKAIETYGIPSELVKHHQISPGHPTPKRFHPVFRDRDELSASSDLGAVIKDALKASHYLIVICSPNAVHSKWVNEEITEFLALGRRNHIFAIIVDGKPNSKDGQECFPLALRQQPEPLAVDVRPEHDGKTNAKLKLMAGMLGVSFDSLKQRDARRKRRRLILAGIATGLLMAMMISLISSASRERQNAGVEKHKAEWRQYVADMFKVEAAWNQTDIPRFTELLNAQRPEHRGGVDYRGFEWYYWMKQSQGEQHLLHKITAHEGGVDAVCFSPDNQWIAAESGEDGTLSMWEAETGKRLFTLDAPQARSQSYPSCICFRPDGKRFAAINSGHVAMYDAATAKLLFSFGPATGVNSFCFSPEGSHIITGGDDGTVRLWDAANGQELLTLVQIPEDVGMITCVCFSPDGKQIAWGGFENVWKEIKDVDKESQKSAEINFRVNGTIKNDRFTYNASFPSPEKKRISVCGRQVVKVLDLATGNALSAFQGKMNSSVESVCFSPDGKTLAIGCVNDDFYGKVLDAKTGKELFKLELHFSAVSPISNGANICFNPDGKRLTLSCECMKIWDATNGKILFVFKGRDSEATSVCFSPDGKRLATGGGDGLLKIWDASNSEPPPFKVSANCALSPDGTLLASNDPEGVTIREVKTRQQILCVKGVRSDPVLFFSPNGQRLAADDQKGGVLIWDVKTGKQLLAIREVGKNSRHDFSSDGRLFALAGPDSNALKVWDVLSGKELFNIKKAAGSDYICFSPDGARLASSKSGRTYGTRPDGEFTQSDPDPAHIQPVTMWDMKSGKQCFQIKDNGSVFFIRFSPDGTKFATCVGSDSSKGAVDVWNATTGEKLFNIKKYGLPMFSLDSKQLAIQCDTLSVWDATNGKSLCSIDCSCYAFCFSPDGKRIAGDYAKTAVKIWDTESGQELLTLSNKNTSEAYQICFNADGKRLTACYADGTVRVWDAANDAVSNKPDVEKPHETSRK